MADLSKNREQALIEAAGYLSLIEVGEPLSAEDHASLDAFFDPLIARLAEDEIVYIGDPDEIPLSMFIPFCRLLANDAGPRFGYPLNEEAQIRDEKTLRRLAAQKPPKQTLKVDYF